MVDELKHVGVLGMRWGRRTSNIATGTKKSTRDHANYMRREHIEEYTRKSARRMSNKKMKEVEKEMAKELAESKRIVRNSLLIIGTLGVMAYAANRLHLG
jgi:hypothetical protein